MAEKLDVPQDIIIDILYCLPAKSIARFRCVSKLWLSILTHSKFIKTHFNINRENEKLLAVYRYPSDSLHAITLTPQNNYISRKLNFPPDLDSNWSEIVGSCGGLVLALDGDHNTKGMFLINPTSSKYNKLPEITFNLRREPNLYGYGFGYDDYSDDFKVVRLSCYDDHSNDTSDVFVDVYSLKANCWTGIDVSPFHHSYYDGDYTSGVLLRGAIHWSACRKTDYSRVIAALDLSTDKFRGVEVPRDVHDIVDDDYSYSRLVVLDYCLCMISENFRFGMDVWMMKEYGVRGSWIKLIRVFYEFNHLIPGLVFGDPDFVALKWGTGELEIFNLKEKRFKSFIVDGAPAMFLDGWTFVESLVSPNPNC